VEIVQASDADRDRVVRDLTRHCGDGRLTLDELEERIAEAYAAATTADLEHALRDLPRQPATVRATRPAAAAATSRSTPAPRDHHSTSLAVKKGAELALRVHLTVYLSVIGFLVAIWFLTGMGTFWPVWPAMSWGLAIAIHAGVTKAVCGDTRS
jgi:hypothetical protein